MLQILGLPQPAEMTGKSLIEGVIPLRTEQLQTPAEGRKAPRGFLRANDCETGLFVI